MVHKLAPNLKPEKVNSGLGDIFMIQKDYENALYHFKILYKATENKSECLIKLGKCFYKMGQI